MTNRIDSELFEFFSAQLSIWDNAKNNYKDLDNVETKDIGDLKVQFNPARIISSTAKIDKTSIEKRPCFLCKKNRPKEQISKPFTTDYEILVNPLPILPIHFTIPNFQHKAQSILESYPTIHKLLVQYNNIVVFYNGGLCGASAPDHLHFQAGLTGLLPIQINWNRLYENSKIIKDFHNNEKILTLSKYPFPNIVIQSSNNEYDYKLFKIVYNALPLLENNLEPMLNIVAWKEEEKFITIIFPRIKHRPKCYFANGKDAIMISPGALDMAGLIILPRKEDYDNINKEKLLTNVLEVTPNSRTMKTIIDNIRRI